VEPVPNPVGHHTGADVVALDLDKALIHQRGRRERAAAAGLVDPRAVQLVRGDPRRLPFPDETFDCVTAISTPDHVAGLHGDRQALSEIARVLRPGGQALVSVPFRHATASPSSAPTAACTSGTTPLPQYVTPCSNRPAWSNTAGSSTVSGCGFTASPPVSSVFLFSIALFGWPRFIIPPSARRFRGLWGEWLSRKISGSRGK
jgi:SAM-dependent methyltransferase